MGHYCPAGSAEAIICDGGTHQNQTGQATCLTCTAGNYCPFTDGSGLVNSTTCPAGYACAETGMTAPAACLKGEYQDLTGQTSCKACPAGSYCDRQALAAVSGTCPGGFYCPANQVDKNGFMCSSGKYCPAGSSAETSCETGKYCDRSALDISPNDCLAGYYCDELETNDPTPSGKQCPRGKYCVVGSSAPVDCPTGTYNNKLGASNDSFCLACPDGRLCNSPGQVEPLGNCTATQYCIGNATFDCPVGHFCPAGYDYQLKCQPGTYQDQTAQSTCKTCTAGNYCYFNSSNLIGSQTVCPAGFYCPAGTPHSDLYPCPAGKLGTTTAYTNLNNCTSCPEKFF